MVPKAAIRVMINPVRKVCKPGKNALMPHRRYSSASCCDLVWADRK